MISILTLWIPILVAAVIVFLVSSLIQKVFTYHRSDFRKLSSEAEVMDDLRKRNIPAGEYFFPRAFTSKEMKSEDYKAKVEKGPAGFLIIVKNAQQSLVPSLIQWFLYSIIINIFAAYISGRVLAPGAHYLEVFRIVGTVSFLSYALGMWQDSIWFFRSWTTTLKYTFDGLIYALLTAGTFGWLWPS